MQYQVFVQNRSGNHYVATVFGLPDCVAEAPTKAQALEKAKTALLERLQQGEIVNIEVGVPASAVNPLLKHAGRFKDDPTYDAVLVEIENYRRELDAEARAAATAGV